MIIVRMLYSEAAFKKFPMSAKDNIMQLKTRLEAKTKLNVLISKFQHLR